MTKSNDIFCTGINGFIGQYLKRNIELTGDNIYSGDAFRAGKWSHVIHLSAVTHIRKEFDPQIFEVNIAKARQYLTSPYRTVFASSCSAADLNNPYAYSKRYGEWLCSNHANALALRLYNVYGPNNNKGIVKALIEAAYSGKEIEIQNGSQTRDFIYVDDVCELIISMLDKPTGVIDIGTGIGTQIRSLVKMVEQLTGHSIKVKWTDFDLSYQQAFSVAHSMPMYNYTSLEDGLRKTIKAYKDGTV